MRALYNITKKMAKRPFGIEKPIKNKDGKVVTPEEKKVKRWVEYFSGIINKPAETETENTLNIKVEPSSKAEIYQALSELKRNKTQCPD